MAAQSAPPAQHPGSPRLPSPWRLQALLTSGNRPGRRPGALTLAVWLPRGQLAAHPHCPVGPWGRKGGLASCSSPAPPRAPVPALAAGLAGTRVRGQRLRAQSQPPAAGLGLGPARGRVQEEVLSLLGGENSTAVSVRCSAPGQQTPFRKRGKPRRDPVTP